MAEISNKIKVDESPNYRTINVAGGIGSHHQLGIQLVLFSDEFDCTNALSETNIDTKKLGIRRIIECRLSLDPYVAINIRNLLNIQISKYEEKFGKIPELNQLVNESKDANPDNKKSNPSDVYT
jgi:hypothetical protein